MRLLVVIPHYYSPHADSKKHGSQHNEVQVRRFKLRQTVLRLQQAFSFHHRNLNIEKKRAEKVNGHMNVDILIHTLGDHHLLNDINLPEGSYRQKQVECEPMKLGFECHRSIAESSRDYDYYAYMEDDLWLHDTMFLDKLSWFVEHVGEDAVLQPNRFETMEGARDYKLYVDGDIRRQATEWFRKDWTDEVKTLRLMNKEYYFKQSANPHSGCFFLNHRQCMKWIESNYFLDDDTRFISPLESAAGLSVFKNFKVYKAIDPNLHFLEIQHAGSAFFSLLGKQVLLD